VARRPIRGRNRPAPIAFPRSAKLRFTGDEAVNRLHAQKAILRHCLGV